MNVRYLPFTLYTTVLNLKLRTKTFYVLKVDSHRHCFIVYQMRSQFEIERLVELSTQFVTAYSYYNTD